MPDNDGPSDLLIFESEKDILSDETQEPGLGPPCYNPYEDIVYNDSNDMSSFLPVGKQQAQELDIVRHCIKRFSCSKIQR